MLTNFTQKNANNYYCEKCDFLSKKKCDYERHLQTKKHNANFSREMLTKKTPIPDEVILDRNRYPEEIEVFRIPDEIPDYKKKVSKSKIKPAS